jgi:multicomponent Na+:H+ antiporter subunit B
MIKKIFAFVLLIALAGVFLVLLQNYETPEELNLTAAYYAEHGAEEVGAANLVSAIVVTYRGLDTLGEVTILFLTASILSFFLKQREAHGKRSVRASSELLRTASAVLVPFIFLLGAYVFINGHLSPGGGFQGGAIIASGLVLLLLTDPLRNVSSRLLTRVESVSGFIYVGLGIAGIFLAGGFLDSRVLPAGTFGTLLSAGLLPILYILIGLKVGTELSGLLTRFQEIQAPENVDSPDLNKGDNA